MNPRRGKSPFQESSKKKSALMLGSGGNGKNSSRKTTPAIVFSSKEIKQITNSMNQPLVISASTINTKIRSVFVDHGSSVDILFRRCFNVVGLTERDLEAHSNDFVGFSGERVTPDVVKWDLKGDISEAERCHSATLHDSKEQLPRSVKPGIAAKIHLVDLVPPRRKISERPQLEGELYKLQIGPEAE
ncbi:hypothetical protein PIB30_087087 [Stylosanthes scabra]|uniref:Uncharacterized protein n=1 Tax=Stylosanthes scabra TaxID=79078 RepID=A0ABU6SVJ6_9FABA|nr:hypothetical protein [Stylosanthes scabra]